MNQRVLIIIPNYNSSEYIGDCLSSLAKINYSKESFEIIIVDDVSTDGSVDFIKINWPNIKLIVNKKNSGFAATANVGFDYAVKNDFDYVYLLNQDTVVDPDFLKYAVVSVQQPGIGAVQSKLLLYNEPTKVNSIGNHIHYLGFAYAGGYKTANRHFPQQEIAYPSGAACLIKVSVLEDVGFFHEELFMYHEDVDLGWRIWLMGYKVITSPQSVVFHKYEFSRSIKKYYYMERNRYIVMLQNYAWPTLILVSPALIVMDLGMFFYSFFSGWFMELIKVYGYFFRWRNWRKIIQSRRLIQSKRKVNDKNIVGRFAGKIEFQDIENPLLKYLVNPCLNFYWQIIKRIIWW